MATRQDDGTLIASMGCDGRTAAVNAEWKGLRNMFIGGGLITLLLIIVLLLILF